MVLGLVYQFNDAFRQYLDAWFGSDESGYLFCLIQNGYLPGESGVCTAPTFSLKSGATKSTIGGTSNAVGGSGSSSKSNGGSSNFAGAGSLGGEGKSGRRGFVPGGPNFGGKGKGSGAAGGGKENTGNADASSSANNLAGGGGGGLNRGGSSFRSGYIPISDSDGAGGAVASKPIPATEQDLKPQTRLLAADKARKKAQEEEDFNGKFSFGKILKYLVIIFILFSMFFFIGSQLLAISQGGKKRR